MYEPKVIIPTEEQSEYKLMLFKEVIKLCEDNQPVNPSKQYMKKVKVYELH